MHPLLSETLDSFHFISESKFTLPYPWNTLSYQAHSAAESGIKLKKIQSQSERRVRNKKGGGSGKPSKVRQDKRSEGG